MSVEVKALLQEIKDLESKIGPLVGSMEVQRKNSSELKRLETQYDSALVELRGLHADTQKKSGELEAEVQKVKEYTATIEKKFGRGVLDGLSNSDFDQRSIATVLTDSPEFKEWHTDKGNFRPIRLKQSLAMHHANYERKDSILGGTATDLREVLSVQKLQQIFHDPLRPDRVRDLIPTITTTLGLVEFLRETTFTNRAAVVAEGATKPTSDVDIDQYQAAMRTLAHSVTVPRQLLEDVPAFRTYLDQRLFDGLKVVEDDQLLYGTGSGANIQGITTTTGVQTYTQLSGDNTIDALRKAMTLSQLAFYPVSGIVLHPIDWQHIELLKDGEDRYLWTNVATGNGPMLWRVPIIVTTAIEQASALLGAFNKGTIVWDRQEANLRISEHHGTVFLENRIVVLVEERLCQTVVLPRAFVNVTLTAGS